jgi:enoyl-CoA hydratase
VSDPVLLVEKKEGIATLTLNRPKAMNALSAELRVDLARAFRQLAADADTRVVILTGAGDRAFCAGLDLKELSGERPTTTSAPEAEIASDADVVSTMEAFERPIIGAINGVAITGGFELALACDVLIGSNRARFADTHARVGLMPGWGLSQKLSRVVGIYRAKQISLTGNFVTAEEAERWGLLCRVVPPEDLAGTCRQLATDMLSCNPEIVVGYKRMIDRGFGLPYAEAREIEREINREQMKGLSRERLAESRRQVTERGRLQARD